MQITVYTNANNKNVVLLNDDTQEIIVCNSVAFTDVENATQAQLAALWEEVQDEAAAYAEGYKYFEQI